MHIIEEYLAAWRKLFGELKFPDSHLATNTPILYSFRLESLENILQQIEVFPNDGVRRKVKHGYIVSCIIQLCCEIQFVGLIVLSLV